jgi:hypothetical protein
MRVHRVSFQFERYQSLHLDDQLDAEQLRLDGDRKGASWRPPRVYVDDPGLERGDFLHLFGVSALVCSARAVEVLERLAVAVELLPVAVDGERLTLVNVVERRNCLDGSATEWSLAPDGARLYPIRYSFHPGRLPGSTLFKIPETAAAEVLCHDGALDPMDEFKHAVEYHKLTGLQFEELWHD